MSNQNGAFTLPSEPIRMPFAVEAAVASLPVFCGSEGMASVLDTLVEFLAQGGYQWIVRTAPSTQQQSGSNDILASQTYEDQISVPIGSFLTMVGGIGFVQSDPSNPANAFNTVSTNFRTKWYDAGAQSALSDGYMHANNVSGNYTPNTGALITGFVRVGGNKNLFILPSPLSITNPGQLNVQITNLATQTMRVDMAYIFAAPIGSGRIQSAKVANTVGR